MKGFDPNRSMTFHPVPKMRWFAWLRFAYRIVKQCSGTHFRRFADCSEVIAGQESNRRKWREEDQDQESKRAFFFLIEKDLTSWKDVGFDRSPQ